MRNEDLYKDFAIKTVTINLFDMKHGHRINKFNAEASVLCDEGTVKRRLERKKPQGFVVDIA